MRFFPKAGASMKNLTVLVLAALVVFYAPEAKAVRIAPTVQVFIPQVPSLPTVPSYPTQAPQIPSVGFMPTVTTISQAPLSPQTTYAPQTQYYNTQPPLVPTAPTAEQDTTAPTVQRYNSNPQILPQVQIYTDP